MSQNKLYFTAAEVAQMLGISVGQAYRMFRQWNKELEEKHYLVIAGKIPVQYFLEKIYGGCQVTAGKAMPSNSVVTGGRNG